MRVTHSFALSPDKVSMSVWVMSEFVNGTATPFKPAERSAQGRGCGDEGRTARRNPHIWQNRKVASLGYWQTGHWTAGTKTRATGGRPYKRKRRKDSRMEINRVQ